MIDFKCLRIIPELRSSLILEVEKQNGVQVLYFEEKYDMRTTPNSGVFKKVSTWNAIKEIFLSDADVIELPEPLWMREILRTLLLCYILKFRNLCLERKSMCVTYAIENNDLESLIFGSRKPLKIVVSTVRTLLFMLTRNAFDKISFGTEASFSVYSKNRLCSNAQVLLPLKKSLLESSSQVLSLEKDLPYVRSSGIRFIFVGVLEKRKGILILIRAWELVEKEDPNSLLTIVGDGHFTDLVSNWALANPHNRRYMGFLGTRDLMVALKNADIAVAPSIRDGRWREQVGLPIVEALASGLTVITSSETGLAKNLALQGHLVLEYPFSHEELASHMLEAKHKLLPRDQVLATSRGKSNRQRAFEWMTEKEELTLGYLDD
jgi:glycosyltransferase involved in cell wall biosynthesis